MKEEQILDITGVPLRTGDLVVLAVQAQGKRPHLRIARVLAFEGREVVITGITPNRWMRKTWRKEGFLLAKIGPMRDVSAEADELQVQG